MDKKKVLIIGLDGFTWRIGNRLIQEGCMPTLSKLIENGCHGILESVIPFETAPAWSSFQTGCFPGKTGVYAFHSYYPKEKVVKLNDSHDILVPSLWEIASQAGKKVVSINMPMTSPPLRINGIIIPGLTCPGIARDMIHPPEIYDRYIKQLSGYQIVNKDRQESLQEYVDRAILTEQNHCNLSLQIMQETDWDIFCVQVQSTDFFQHRNWWSLDSCADGFTENDFLKSSAFYRYIDKMVGQLVDTAGDGVLVLLASDHGFVAKKADLGINSWLAEKGYLKLKQPELETKGIIKKQLKANIPFIQHCARFYGKAKNIISDLFFKANSAEPGLFAEKQMRHIREIIDLDNTVAFCLGGLAGLMYMNAQNEELTRQIIDELLATYGPDSPEPLISDIQPAEKVYTSGARRAHSPDYVIMLSAGVENRIEPQGAVVRRDEEGSRQTGTHDPNGVYIISGNDVRSNLCLDCQIVDIAPTILAYLDIPIREHIDGTVLQDVFEKPLNIMHSSEQKETESGSRKTYSNREQAEVEKQLRDLGYL